jgi:hypothetical protein
METEVIDTDSSTAVIFANGDWNCVLTGRCFLILSLT